MFPQVFQRCRSAASPAYEDGVVEWVMVIFHRSWSVDVIRIIPRAVLQSRSSDELIRWPAGSSRKLVPLRELIGYDSSWQPATRLQEDNSRLAVLSGPLDLFLVFPRMVMHGHSAAGLQCYVHQRLRSAVITSFISLSSRKEPLKEHEAKVHRYRFPETWSSVRCRTLNSIKYSPVTSAAQR